MKVIDLRKDIDALLTSIHPEVMINGKPVSRVHYEEAPDNAEFPYIVYNLPDSINLSSVEVFDLEIDFFDDQKDTTRLETLCYQVDKALDRRTVMISDTVGVAFYREHRRNIRENDKRLRRRYYEYQSRVIGE